MEIQEIFNEIDKRIDVITTALEPTVLDYFIAIIPIIISVIALMISVHSNKKIKKLESTLVWDDLHSKYYILIKNTGNKSVILKSITLYAFDKKTKTYYNLGTRENAWSSTPEKAYIEPNTAICIEPSLRSNYDVFSYRGHIFEVTDDIRDLPIKIAVKDTDNKSWENETKIFLGEIDDVLNQNI